MKCRYCKNELVISYEISPNRTETHPNSEFECKKCDCIFFIRKLDEEYISCMVKIRDRPDISKKYGIVLLFWDNKMIIVDDNNYQTASLEINTSILTPDIVRKKLPMWLLLS